MRMCAHTAQHTQCMHMCHAYQRSLKVLYYYYLLPATTAVAAAAAAATTTTTTTTTITTTVIKPSIVAGKVTWH